MKVSIIMTVYNKEKWIRRCIESVLNQTYRDYELIIINDGSTDNSISIIQEYIQGHSEVIRLINQDNAGVSKARNTGIDNAIGDAITFIDADDAWHQSFLEKMVNRLGDLNVVYCGHWYINGSKEEKARIAYSEGSILKDYIQNRCTPNTNSWLIRRDFLNRLQLRFNENISWGEDMLFFAAILQNDSNIRSVREELTQYYIQKKGSLSQNSIEKIDLDLKWMALLKVQLEQIPEKRDRIDARLAVSTYRMPAAVIYRLASNLDSMQCGEIRNTVYKYIGIISQIRITNGIRSCKLILATIVLFLRIIRRCYGTFIVGLFR